MHIIDLIPIQQLFGLGIYLVKMVKATQCSTLCVKASTTGFLSLMGRFQANRKMILNVESELCPKIRKRLYKEKMTNNKWLVCWASHTKFEVKNMLESFIVDLAKSKCSYRKWDITDIPCVHTISCKFFNREKAEKYVDECYKVTTYQACYEPLIDPINGQNMQRPSVLPPVQPPIKRIPPGRPKKRAKEPDEPLSGRK